MNYLTAMCIADLACGLHVSWPRSAPTGPLPVLSLAAPGYPHIPQSSTLSLAIEGNTKQISNKSL